jgi:hypothetical protein
MGGKREFTRRAAIATGVGAVASAFAGCLGGGGDNQQSLETTFDSGNEGWTVADLEASDSNADPDWGSVIQELELDHEQEGGVDNSGYVKRVDTTPNAFFFDAPDTYLGDMSPYVGGTLDFHLKSTHNNYRLDSALVLQGTDGVIATQFGPPGPDWTQYRIALDAEARTYHESNLNGPEVGQERVEAVLSDLQALRISGEHGSAVQETVSLDEVRLRSA